MNDDRESPSYVLINLLKKKNIFWLFDPYFDELKKGRNNQTTKKSIILKAKIFQSMIAQF